MQTNQMQTLVLIEADAARVALARTALQSARGDFDLLALTSDEDACEWVSWAAKNDAPMPTLILLSLNLPKLNGLAILRTVRLAQALRAVPVVVYSAFSTQPDVQMSYLLGANSFVDQPDDLPQFVELFSKKLSHWLD